MSPVIQDSPKAIPGSIPHPLVRCPSIGRLKEEYRRFGIRPLRQHVVMIIIGSQLQVRLIEEPYLTATHGQAYRDYCEAVDRFLPGIGRIRRA